MVVLPFSVPTARADFARAASVGVGARLYPSGLGSIISRVSAFVRVMRVAGRRR